MDRLEKKVRRAAQKVTKLAQPEASTSTGGRKTRTGTRRHAGDSDAVLFAREPESVANADDSWGSASEDGTQPQLRAAAPTVAIAPSPEPNGSAAHSADDDSWGSDVGEEIPTRLRSSSTVAAVTSVRANSPRPPTLRSNAKASARVCACACVMLCASAQVGSTVPVCASSKSETVSHTAWRLGGLR